MSDALTIEPLAAPPDATVVLPGSKSITNRALVCAALAAGTSTLRGALVADDTAAMVGCLRELGARVDVDGDRFTVEGTGGHLQPGPVTLDVRSSGTTARFVIPVVAAGTGRYTIDGTEQMRSRPIAPLVAALRDAGVGVVEIERSGRLPIIVSGGSAAHHVRVSGDVSSQFLSGLLLAAPLWPHGLDVEVTTPLVSRPYVDMTVAVMAAFGVVTHGGDDRYVVGRQHYEPRDYAVEPDASAASYFFAAAAITGGRVRVEGLGRDSLQGDVAFVDVLEQMGAQVVRSGDAIEVRGAGTLRGVDVDLSQLSDTAQTLAVVAAFAEGPTTVRGIGFIRAKETDRIGAVVRELWRCGIDAQEEDDGFTVVPGEAHGARIETYDDHRMAMAFALLGLRVPGIEIADPGCVAKTFPGYWSALEGLRG